MLPTPVLTWSLRIDCTVVGDVHVFAPAGRLGTLSSGDLIEALAGAIKGGARLVLVDLAAVDYISSAGLLALGAISGRVQAAGGELVLCGLVEPVRLAFDLAGLLPDFAVAPSRDLAHARFAAGNASASDSHQPETDLRISSSS
jgi:anti-anti-sigma factor